MDSKNCANYCKANNNETTFTTIYELQQIPQQLVLGSFVRIQHFLEEVKEGWRITLPAYGTRSGK